MKIIIVGGVAGGATAAARIRRNTEEAEIILFEKGAYNFVCQLWITLLHRWGYRGTRTAFCTDARSVRETV